MSYSEIIADSVKRFLKKCGMYGSFDEERGRFSVVLPSKYRLSRLHYNVSVKEDAIACYVTSPVSPDTDDPRIMAAMAEYVCRINAELAASAFELDFSDGTVCCRRHIYCGSQEPGDDLLNFCWEPIILMENYGDGILDIIYGGVNAETAFRRCEEARRSKKKPAPAEVESGADTRHTEAEGSGDKHPSIKIIRRPPADSSAETQQGTAAKKTSLF